MGRRRKARITHLAAAALTLGAAPLHGATIVIGVPVQEDGLETTRSWSSLCRGAREDSGVELRPAVLKDNETALDQLRLRFIDLAVIDPAWYLEEGRDLVPLLEARAAPAAEARVSLIVPRSSICYRTSDLAGRRIALTRPGQGAAGNYVPLAMLAEAGAAGRGAPDPVFAETFESILKGVAYESLEAGAVPSYLLSSPAGLACADFIRVIAESEPLPQLLVVRRAGDDPERYDPVVRALAGLSGAEEGGRVLGSSGLVGFAPIGAADFRALERYLKAYRSAYDAPR